MTLLLSLLAFVLGTISVIGLIVFYKLFKDNDDIEKNLKNNDKQIQNDYYFEKFFEMMNTIKHIDDKLDAISDVLNKYENQAKILIEQNTSLKKEKSAGDEK